MKNIKAIIFDLGAVILNINYQNTIDEFGKIGIQNASSYYSKKAQNSLFNQIETGEISDKEFLLKLQKETPNINIKQVEDAWNAMLLDLPENRINLLKKLKTTYSIFLLSNTNSIHIAEFKKRLGNNQYNKFYNLFDKVYYSHKIGFRKPQSEAFQIILDENKLLANEVFFIDDSYQHIKGAKKLGIKTHHLQENEEITTLFPDIAL
jgi:HAD superfamily hydrolase (TIGR01509 family)